MHYYGDNQILQRAVIDENHVNNLLTEESELQKILSATVPATVVKSQTDVAHRNTLAFWKRRMPNILQPIWDPRLSKRQTLMQK